MLIKIISDIHLEFNPDYELPVSKESKDTVLCLLGDIGDPTRVSYCHLIGKAARFYSVTILVAGNHEYYNHTTERRMDKTKELIKEIVKPFYNVYFLDDSCVSVNGFKFAGTTLWSKIKKEEKIPVMININDFRMIPKMTLEMYDMLHNNSVYWLNKVINEAVQPLIILTHHAPLTEGTSHPKYTDTNTNSAFGTDLSAMFKKPVVAWFFGHTHFACDFSYNGIKIISNPVGYPKEESGYNPEQSIEFTLTNY